MEGHAINDQVWYQSIGQDNPTEEQAIYGEIAERMVELDEHSWSRLYQWIARIHQLSEFGRRVFLWYMYFQSGNHEAIGRTLQQAADDHACSKQAEQQELQKEFDRARSTYPELIECMEQLMSRQQGPYPDPVAPIYRAGGGMEE